MPERKKASKSKKRQPKASVQATASNKVNINIDMSRPKRTPNNVRAFTRGMPLGYVGLRGMPYHTSTTTVINNQMPSEIVNGYFAREMMRRSILDEAKSLKMEHTNLSPEIDTVASYLTSSIDSNSTPRMSDFGSHYGSSSSSSGPSSGPQIFEPPRSATIDMASATKTVKQEPSVPSVKSEPMTSYKNPAYVPLPGSSIASTSMDDIDDFDIKSEPMTSQSIKSEPMSNIVPVGPISKTIKSEPRSQVSSQGSNSVWSEQASNNPGEAGPSRPRGSQSTVEQPERDWRDKYARKLEAYEEELAMLKSKPGSSRQQQESVKSNIRKLATKVASKTDYEALMQMAEETQPSKGYYTKLSGEIRRVINKSDSTQNNF